MVFKNRKFYDDCILMIIQAPTLRACDTTKVDHTMSNHIVVMFYNEDHTYLAGCVSLDNQVDFCFSLIAKLFFQKIVACYFKSKKKFLYVRSKKYIFDQFSKQF